MRTRLTTALLAVGATLAAAPTAGGAVGTRATPEAAVTWAMSQVGTRERGTTNCSAKIDRWERNMGLRVPPCRVWCGAFVHEAYLRAGVRLSARLIDPDRSYGDAVAGRRGLRRIALSQIRRGDIVFYAFRRDLRASDARARARASESRIAGHGRGQHERRGAPRASRAALRRAGGARRRIARNARLRRICGRFAGHSEHTCAPRLSAIDAATSVGAQPIGGPM